MSTIFLIPGLGADCRIFKNLELPGHEVINVVWVKQSQTDTLTTYAQKLIDHYHIAEGTVVIGNSMGGMLAIEIGKVIHLDKIILISSIGTIEEAPDYFGFFRTLPVYKKIPDKFFTSVDFLLELVFGEMDDNDIALFKDMLNNTPPEFLKWAMCAILNWVNKAVPPNVFQISGDKDRVFPYKKLKKATILTGGTHIMIFDKPKVINKWLKDILQK